MNFFNFKGVSQNKMNEFNNINNFNQKQNIMKKSILLLAVAASFAACTQNEEINDAISQQEIKFDQVLNKTTKAEIVDKAALAEGGFAVFGYKSTDRFASNKTTVFVNGVKVYSVNSGNNWKYDKIRYWDKTATYAFYAIAPFEAIPNYSLVDNKFVVENVTSGLASESKDYIIDRTLIDESNISGNRTDATNEAIGFEFHHIMAKVVFEVIKGVEDGESIEITSLKMSGYNDATGTFNQSKTDGTWKVLDCSEWKLSDDSYDAELVLIDENTVLNDDNPSKSLNSYIMVPQNIENGLTFTVDYILTYVDGTEETFTEQSAKIADPQLWGTDSHTTYQLTIGGGALPINFDVITVCNFCVDGNEKGNDGDVTIDQ